MPEETIHLYTTEILTHAWINYTLIHNWYTHTCLNKLYTNTQLIYSHTPGETIHSYTTDILTHAWRNYTLIHNWKACETLYLLPTSFDIHQWNGLIYTEMFPRVQVTNNINSHLVWLWFFFVAMNCFCFQVVLIFGICFSCISVKLL